VWHVSEAGIECVLALSVTIVACRKKSLLIGRHILLDTFDFCARQFHCAFCFKFNCT
jgi:hypothetical protein